MKELPRERLTVHEPDWDGHVIRRKPNLSPELNAALDKIEVSRERLRVRAAAYVYQRDVDLDYTIMLFMMRNRKHSLSDRLRACVRTFGVWI